MSSSQWAVECSHVEFAPLSDFSLRVAHDEIVVLLGESDSGKTAALRLINALALPDKGEVFVEGRATKDWDIIELRHHISTILQDDSLFPHFSVAQNIGLVPELLGWEHEKIEASICGMLELLNLPPAQFTDRFPAQLSKSQRQRVGIARALAANQSLLLLDEPFGHLDPLAREKLRDDFAQLCRNLNKTAIFATSDLREALLLGDKIALLCKGKLAFFGVPQEFALTDEPTAVAYRATMDLPAWMASKEDAEASEELALSGEIGIVEIEVKEPGLRAKLKRAGKRLKAKF